MTEAELLKILDPQNNDGPTLIMGDKMKDVAFFPLSITITATHYELGGIWYSNVMGDLMADGFGNPAREVIKIKKEDLAKWNVKPEAADEVTQISSRE